MTAANIIYKVISNRNKWRNLYRETDITLWIQLSTDGKHKRAYFFASMSMNSHVHRKHTSVYYLKVNLPANQAKELCYR